MNPGALRALEFDRIVAVLSGLAVTPTGRDRLEALNPSSDVAEVTAALKTTSEAVRFLSDHPGFPLRAPADLHTIVDALDVEGRPLEPVHLLAVAEFLESIEHSRTAVAKLGPAFPLLRAVADAAASFKGEIADVRRKIAPSGDVTDEANQQIEKKQ